MCDLPTRRSEVARPVNTSAFVVTYLAELPTSGLRDRDYFTVAHRPRVSAVVRHRISHGPFSVERATMDREIFHSLRRDCIGSERLALKAGMRPAIPAAAASTKLADAKASGA
jgi:hypothetical protein